MLRPEQHVDIELPEVRPRAFTPHPQAFLKGMRKLPEALKIMGYEKLREGQDKAVFNLFHHRDTYAILPTAHGKTAISVVPSLCMDWKCLIFSPLVALMQDQVTSLQRLGLKAGQISSGQTPAENMMSIKGWELGELQFLFVAPERLENSEFLRISKLVRPNLVVLDEAHVCSEWSDSFRPSYTKIGNFIAAVNPDAVLAMTATSTPQIEADVRRVLGITGAAKVLYLPARKELLLHSENYTSDHQVLRILEKSPVKGPTIVYCATRKRCEEMFANIGNVITGGSLVYHGGMPSDARTSNQNLFMSGDVRVMFATNAFGMGIDKRDIRMILHRDIPGSIEALAQETGRSGRDGKESLCVQLVSDDAFRTHEFLLEGSHPDRRTVERVYHALVKHADADKRIMKTGADLSALIGIRDMYVNAALGILKSSGVIDREDDEVKPVTIRILKQADDPKMEKLLADVKTYGMTLPDGAIDLHLELLLSNTGRKYATVHNHLKRLAKEGFIIYTTPFRGKTTTLKGDLSLVDFQRLEQRREDAYAKLDSVREYLRVPDEQKHQFLTDYFGR